MMRCEVGYAYNQMRRRRIGGTVSSIWKDDALFIGAHSYPLPRIVYMTSDFSDFEKFAFSTPQNMVYHLSGYGTSFNEAQSSYLGESAERFSFAMAGRSLKSRSVISSYRDLTYANQQDYVCPLEFINSYFPADDESHMVREDDVIRWIPMNSLFDSSRKVYMPLQFVVTNDGGIFADEKSYMTSAVSTGTACGENFSQALTSAVIEYLQIDSFNLWWYGGYAGNPIHCNIRDFLVETLGDTQSVDSFLRYFRVEFTDITFDKSIDVVVCEIFSEMPGMPKYTVGVQGGTERKRVMYRGFLEALAVLEYNMNLPWMDTEKYRSVKRNTVSIANLDDNVILYAKYGKPRTVTHDRVFSGATSNRDENPFRSLNELSRYSGFLTITAPEVQDMNLEVVRVCVPELLPLCLPSYPPVFHRRYEQIGGIANNVPHPLA